MNNIVNLCGHLCSARMSVTVCVAPLWQKCARKFVYGDLEALAVRFSADTSFERRPQKKG